MHSNRASQGTSANVEKILSAAATILMVYGALGVATSLRLLALLAQGMLGWSGIPDAASPPVGTTWLAALQEHYDARPWLPWFAWLLGSGLLMWRWRRSFPRAGGSVEGERPHMASHVRARWVAPAALLLLVLFGGFIRMGVLWPQSTGLQQLPYDDEGVYAGASQLFVQGLMPYRDYFFAHPPVAAFSYAPAMLYHFTQWGSPTSFMMARYLSVFYSLITLTILFLIGYRLVGLLGASLAGMLWALDGRVVEINRKVMLDGPMVLLSCVALLLYLWVRPALSLHSAGSTPARLRTVLFLVGVCAALSALTKIAGVACLLAIVSDVAWLWLNRRGSPDATRSRLLSEAASLAGGVLAAVALIVLPFLFMAPSQIVRDVVFFQLLRPGDGTVDITARIGDLTSTLANGLTMLSAGLGFLLLSQWVFRQRQTGPWRVVVLWTFFSMLIFSYSRSFYPHYYIQLAAPLCLLGGGLSLFNGVIGRIGVAERLQPIMSARAMPVVAAALLGIIALPLALTQWTSDLTMQSRPVFAIVGRYVSDAVHPGIAVLASDEQFDFLAARPPSRNATGYMIDSYGHMISLGLGLATRDWGDLWSAALRGEHTNDPYAMMHRAAPQADFLDRASRAALIVIHDKGFPRLTAATLNAIKAQTTVAEQKNQYTIYRSKAPKP
ncbi:MAG: phospholipid carrier-dependent glycosyltransferase [Chloroflexota bacterium]|nr:phospholipid carrier-dependent glycosyltransferase [Chloroflexota bacterium]